MSEDDILEEALTRVARVRSCTKHDVYQASCGRKTCQRPICAELCFEIESIKREQEERRAGARDACSGQCDTRALFVPGDAGDTAHKHFLKVADGPTAPAPVRGILPDDDKARLEYPMADGLLYYFPAALAEVARISKIGNDQHNPGLPLHWARGKSTDYENKILRHLAEAGTKDSRGVRHSARLAWRALALLQVELEKEEGAPLPRNARF